MLPGHGVLGTHLSHLNQVKEATLTFHEPSFDSLVRVLRETFVLYDEVVQVVTEVVRARCSAMTVEDTEEADLGPIHCQVLFAFRLEDIENNRDSILIIVPNNTLIRVCCVAFDHATLLLGGLSGLVILEEEGLGIQHRRVLTE